jgi:pilus assembly protein FimV
MPGWDETATKLDLAKAYIDMGDSEGARSILDEVIAEGNESQKQQAQALVAQIAA